MMHDVEAEFRKLPLVGCAMGEFRVIPKRKLSVTFTNHGDAAGDPEPGQYDIQFNKIQDFRLDLPWRGSRVIAQEVFASSEYLAAAVIDPSRPVGEMARYKLHHFHFAFDIGRIDILAENFVVSRYW